jgi:hypothetical protein
MRSGLLLAVALLLGLGLMFARDRLKRAFQVGALLYAVVLVFRFALFGRADSDYVGDLLLVLSIFGLIWLVAWLVTHAILCHRTRARSSGR